MMRESEEIMANAPIINVGGTDYNLMDKAARTGVNDSFASFRFGTGRTTKNLYSLANVFTDKYIDGAGDIQDLAGTKFMQIPVFGFQVVSLTLDQGESLLVGRVLMIAGDGTRTAVYNPADYKTSATYNNAPIYTFPVPQGTSFMDCNLKAGYFDATNTFKCVENATYLQSLKTDYTDNLYSLANIINDKYIDGTGSIETYAGAKFASIPVKGITKIQICLGISGKEAAGQVLFGTLQGAILSSFTPINYKVSGMYQGSYVYEYNVPQNSDYLFTNIKVNAYDASSTMIITARDLLEGSSSGQAESVLHNKHISLIGDSITEYNFRAGTNWPMWLAQWTGCIVQNLGVSGTGFYRHTSQQQNQYVNRISSISGTPDMIGVAVTINDPLAISEGASLGTITDTQSSNTVLGYVNTFIQTLIAAFPTVPIIFYVQCTSEDYGFKKGSTVGDGYVTGVRALCQKYGVPFYDDMYEKGSVLKPWILANRTLYFQSDNNDIGSTGVIDTIHPNSVGSKVVAQRLLGSFEANVVR
jgi:lysophospholipase L1-like esterase